MFRRGQRLSVTRLRVLRRGWGRFTAESVTIPDLDQEAADRSALDIDDVLDLDDEDAETGLPDGRERPN